MNSMYWQCDGNTHTVKYLILILVNEGIPGTADDRSILHDRTLDPECKWTVSLTKSCLYGEQGISD